MPKLKESTGGTTDGYFGPCPACHKTDGYLNVGREHWFVCKAHRNKWFVGAKLFSSWMYETAEEQLRQQQKIGFDSFTTVEPYCPFPETEEDVEDAVTGDTGSLDELC